MRSSLWIVTATVAAALSLGACSSARFGGAPIRSAAAAPANPPPVEAVPSGPVTSAPLPPLEGQPLPPVAGAPMSGMPGAAAPGTEVAGLPPAAAPAPAATPAPASRTAMVGNWTATVAGGSCKVQLTSSPSLDLYRASATGCPSQDLSRIYAWDYRDGEVYLYQTGGAVAARLRGSPGSLSGVLAKSGAPISLSR
ncbi:AprI/Inh family metalloprotease inhibitor [Microvirga thermotolerans]|uniref:AprI/Inh family metalloprotease inhibitor n=1 Tax=Microvirga thermotolerans TaxID=2651334 RepID=A0A5P9JR95_9HYPH|nr:AprI/Inh family metalloprotease inhibitor [Microvirga thermotolerans]QFU15177.1 AprI/Inh family metalloprotease inhibitor [Microvirga thermotolerans]